MVVDDYVRNAIAERVDARFASFDEQCADRPCPVTIESPGPGVVVAQSERTYDEQHSGGVAESLAESVATGLARNW